MAKMVIEAETRDQRGKNEARRLRHSGWVPGVLYGAEKDTLPVTLNPKQLNAVLQSEAGHNTILNVNLKNGESTAAMIVDWQYEPLKGALLHVDLKRIAMDKVLHVKVPIVAVGEAPGVKTQGGILEYVAREIEVACLPDDIPEHVNADVSNLNIGTNVRAKDLQLGEKVKLASDPEAVLLHVIMPKAEEAKAEEAAVEGAEAAPAEPEVIRKGKAEKEEEGEAAEAAPAEKGEKKEKKEKK